MQSINMLIIYYWDKKLKKRLHVLEADIITFKKNWFDVSNLKDAFFYRTCSKWSPLRLSQ